MAKRTSRGPAAQSKNRTKSSPKPTPPPLHHARESGVQGLAGVSFSVSDYLRNPPFNRSPRIITDLSDLTWFSF
jgi:hypothetical protein